MGLGWHHFPLVFAGLVVAIIAGYNKLVGCASGRRGVVGHRRPAKRRTDLVPNVVEAVKVTPRTSGAHSTRSCGRAARRCRRRGPSAGPGGEPADRRLRQLFALAESYPDLKATRTSVTSGVVGEIEETIQNSRRYYNAVSATSTQRSTAPVESDRAVLPVRQACVLRARPPRRPPGPRVSSGAERIGRTLLLLALVLASAAPAARSAGPFSIDTFVTSILSIPRQPGRPRRHHVRVPRHAPGVFRRIPLHYWHGGIDSAGAERHRRLRRGEPAARSEARTPIRYVSIKAWVPAR